MKKNKISKNWINKQRRDIYVRQSKVDGYRARSAYKLMEIDEKFKIFKGGLSVIDIGAAPGSWSQYAIKSKIEYSKARKLAFSPHINIGVFSMEANSPGWSSWQKNLFQTLKAGNIFGSEGLAINMSVYIDELKTEFLPLNCNWITSNLLPKYDENNDTFVEPFLPNYKIGIMHLAAGIWKDGKDMRIDKSIKIEIKTLQDKKILKSLRYSN